MTLYRHFDSKDDLIVAYLQSVALEVDEMWRDFERDHPGDMQAQLKAWLVLRGGVRDIRRARLRAPPMPPSN